MKRSRAIVSRIIMIALVATRTRQGARAFQALASTARISQQPLLTCLFSASTEDPPSSKEHLHTPWNRPEDQTPRRSNKTRFRQHVNPLSSLYQMPTPLSDDWPCDVFEDLQKPLHLDIGCGKGGFLLQMAKERTNANYLGLEIRPDVAKLAQDRIAKRSLEGKIAFVGCNANVDLDRLLSRYTERAAASAAYGTSDCGTIQLVSIQFPDPHFKTQHNKRRVVTLELVETLAKFLPPGESVVFLQSDIREVLDDMRLKFRARDAYFRDEVEDVNEYMPDNFIGIPTEREVSVLEQGLPIYRTVFRRTETLYVLRHPAEDTEE